jgi:hypothetical protein
MNQTFFVLAALAATAICQPTAAQKNETLEGNGNVVTKNISIQPFTTLDASGVYELKLTQGATESVKIEADENLQELFIVRNDGSKLVIEMKELKNKNLKSKNKMRVYVQFKNLKAMNLKMVGNFSGGNDLAFDDLELTNASVGDVDLSLKATSLHLKNASVGNMKLSGRAENAVMKMTGVGELQAGDFVVQTLDINNSGVGSADVNATKSLIAKDSFLGRVKNKGNASTGQ